MGQGEEGAQPEIPVAEDLPQDLNPEQIRQYRLQQEAEYYKTEEGFLDFVRDSGAAPDAQMKPHGQGARSILNWTKYDDPESEKGYGYLFKMQLWPRGSFKSAVFDVGFAAWNIARDPNIRICVCSSTGKQARKFVKQTMQIIDSQWFRERFGVHKGKDWKEGTGSFTSAQRTDSYKKESTLQSAGTGEVWTGSHWDLVIFDDVIDQENTRTPEAIESTRYWFGEILAQLDPGCQLLMIGTLHHYADLYCSIMKDPEMRKLFEFSVHSWLNKDGTLFFPGRLTRKFVEQQKALLPPRLFACFYENKPTTAEEQIFRPEYFRVIPDEDIPQHVWTYILTDFAFIAEEKKKGKADRTVFWVVSIDCNRVAYVRDFYVGRWKPSDSVRIVCDIWNRYQGIDLKGVAIELVTHTEVLSSLFDEIRRETFIRPKLIPISGRSQEIKDVRIEGIEPTFRNGNIYFAQSLKNQFQRKWKPLIDEMTEWPFSNHDDIPDAISDLHKTDKDGRWMLPAPPPGWRRSEAVVPLPTMVDGRYNPNRAYPADEFTKEGQRGNDLWQRSSEKTDSLFRGRNRSGGMFGPKPSA
jgi:hypothetical protein